MTATVPRRPVNQRQCDWDARVPNDYQDANLSELGPEVEAEIRAWFSEIYNTPDDPQPQGSNLVIAGPVGVGKTHAGFAACAHMHFVGFAPWDVNEPSPRSRPRVQLVPGGFQWWSQLDLLRDLRLHEAETMQMLDRPSLLFIDDIGSARQTPWVLDAIHGTLDTRRRNSHPMVVTTNLVLPEFEQYVGQGAYSRLMDGAFVIEMRGRNRRAS